MLDPLRLGLTKMSSGCGHAAPKDPSRKAPSRDYSRWYQWLWPHRPQLLPCRAGFRRRHRDRRGKRPDRYEDSCASAQVRQHPRSTRQGRHCRRQRDHRRWHRHLPRLRRARPGQPALGQARRRRRPRVHGLLQGRRELWQAHHRRRQEGHHLRACQGRGHHHRDGRQPPGLRPGDGPHHLQRLVHDELPRDADGTITDDGRVRASVPTIKALSEAGARVVVCAHLGRPKGAPEAKYSLAPVARRLQDLLATRVVFATDTVGESARSAATGLGDGQILLLENLRFNPGETSKDDDVRDAFADELASLAEVFVSDGFGVVHRKQASVYDVAQRLPHAVGGLVQTEVEVLKRLTESVERPYAVMLGGAKVSDKLGVIANLLQTADRLLIGGGMVFTFLAAQGHEVGKSLLEADQIDVVKGYLAQAQERGVEIILPTDIVAATAFSAEAEHSVVDAHSIPADRIGLDIGPESAKAFAAKLVDARTVFWNGPMGAFEMAPYAAGTKVVAQALVEATSKGALTVIGGGDSAAAVRQLGFADSQFGHISTGGGASLEYLEGKALPGLTVLEG